MSVGTRRIVGAAVLAGGSVWAGSQVDPALTVATLALSAACGAALMWIGIRRKLFQGQPRPAWQSVTLAGVGAAIGISVVNALDYLVGPSAGWLFLAALLAWLAGAVVALRLSPYGEKMLE